MSACTIAVVTRDRFSTTKRCVEAILKNTPAGHDVLVVMGGVPDKLQKEWQALFGDKVRWHFEPELRNPCELRNIALRQVRTPLAVLMDNDVYPRPGWLEPLLQCQAETGAAMVVPLVLEKENIIHTAGNDFLITYRAGKANGCKELRFGSLRYFEGCNLPRRATEYGELHSQLVVVETALKLGVYDEKFREGGEVDSGMIWAKAGQTMFVEPKSVVHFDLPDYVRHAEDIRPFLYKWDTPAIVEGYRHFENKWNIDLTEGGAWPEFLVLLNSKLGFFPRLFPNTFGIALDRVYRSVREIFRIPGRALHALRRKRLGRSAW